MPSSGKVSSALRAIAEAMREAKPPTCRMVKMVDYSQNSLGMPINLIIPSY